MTNMSISVNATSLIKPELCCDESVVVILHAGRT